MYKVFFNEKVVFLTDNLDHQSNDQKGMFYTFQSSENMRGLINIFMANEDMKQLYIYHDDLEMLIDHFKALFEFCEAGGGLVYNKEDQILIIKRHGKWDLPKGKPKKKEKIEDTAIREVQEECGISNLVIKSALHSTYHTYFEDDKHYLKKSHWYNMYYEGKEELVPQEEEGITFAKWFYQDEIKTVLENTYPSVIDVLKMADVIKKRKKPRFN